MLFGTPARRSKPAPVVVRLRESEDFSPTSLTRYRTTPADRQAIRDEFAKRGTSYFAQCAEAVQSRASAAELRHLPIEDRVSLWSYTAGSSRTMNQALRAKDADRQIRAMPSIKGAASALNALSPWEGISTRVTRFSPERMAPYLPGTIVIEPAFFSTSSYELPIPSFLRDAATEFRVKANGLGKSIDLLSHDPYEAEILFPPGTRFYVVSNAFSRSVGRTVIELEQV